MRLNQPIARLRISLFRSFLMEKIIIRDAFITYEQEAEMDISDWNLIKMKQCMEYPIT